MDSINRYLRVTLVLLISGCVAVTEEPKKIHPSGLIITPPSYYSTAKARHLGDKYKENLDRIVDRIVQNQKTSNLQFANNIASVGGLGFFTHSAAKTPDERYLEAVLTVPDTFQAKGDYSTKLYRLFSSYGSELLSILSSDSAIYQDKEVAGYGLNLAWRALVADGSGSRVVVERAVAYFPKERVQGFLKNRVNENSLLAGAAIFAVEDNGPMNLVSYRPQEKKPDFRPPIQEENIVASRTESVSEPGPGALEKELPPVLTRVEEVEQSQSSQKKVAASSPSQSQEKASQSQAIQSTRKKADTEATSPAPKPAVAAASKQPDSVKPSQPVEVGPPKNEPVVQKAGEPEAAPKDGPVKARISASTPTIAPAPVAPVEVAKATGPAMPKAAFKPAKPGADAPPASEAPTTPSAAGQISEPKISVEPLKPAKHGASPAKSSNREGAPSAREAKQRIDQSSKDQPIPPSAQKPLANPVTSESSKPRQSSEPRAAQEAGENAPAKIADALSARAPRVELAKKEEDREAAAVTNQAQPQGQEKAAAKLPKQASPTVPLARRSIDSRSPGGQGPAAKPPPEIVNQHQENRTAESVTVKAKSKTTQAAPDEKTGAQAPKQEAATAPSESRSHLADTITKTRAASGAGQESSPLLERTELKPIEIPAPAIPAAQNRAGQESSSPRPAKTELQPIEIARATSVPAAEIKPEKSSIDSRGEQLALVRKPSPVVAAPKPLAKVSPKALQGYIIQIAFSDRIDARRWAETFERRGHAVSMTATGGASVRLRIGNFSLRADAERQLQRLRQDGLTGIVVNLPQAYRPEASSPATEAAGAVATP